MSEVQKHGNVCPICGGRFGSAVFEGHVDLCLKQSFIKEAAKAPRVFTVAELATQVTDTEDSLFSFLDNLEQVPPETRTEYDTQVAARHLANSLKNAHRRLCGIYDRMGIEIAEPWTEASALSSALQNAKASVRGNDRARNVEVKSAANSRISFDPRRSMDPRKSVSASNTLLNEDQERMFQEFLRKEGTCNVCKKFKGPENLLVMEQGCDHRFCPECLKSYLQVLLAAPKLSPSTLTCPADEKCLHRIPDWMSKRVLTQEEIDKLLAASLSDFIGKSNNIRIIKCPNAKCNSMFEAVAGGGADDGLDNDGKPLTLEAKQHKSTCRFRCPTCATIFCSECNAIPYHLGYTCETWQQYQEAKHCRFCENVLTPENMAKLPLVGSGPGITYVCNDEECLRKRKLSCVKVKDCGHVCGGVKNERRCLPCMHPDCVGEEKGSNEDFCNICWVESIASAPAVKLKCGHVFHYTCIKSKVRKKWSSARIHFGFLNCPLCKKIVDHPALNKDIKPYLKLKQLVQAKALQRLRYEGLENDPHVTDASSPYHNNPGKYAMDIFAYYPCYKCKLPYFGGRRECEQAAQEEEAKYDPRELVCGSCAMGNDLSRCKIHGREFIEYKCKWCCSIAQYFCWGTTHFCESCHKRQEQGDYLTKKKKSELPKCPGPGKCPLGIAHPPNGTEFAIGCGLCRPRN